MALIEIRLPYLLRKTASEELFNSDLFSIQNKIASFANLPTGNILSFLPLPKTLTKLKSDSKDLMLTLIASEASTEIIEEGFLNG